MPNLRIFLLCVLAALLTTSPLTAGAAQPEGKAAHCVFHFPKNINFGRFAIAQARWGQHPMTIFKTNALGEVKADVPDGYVTVLDLGSEVFRNPDLLKLIADQPIEAIDTSFSAMDDSETAKAQKVFGIISQFHNLKELNVDRSDASDISLSKFHQLPQLRYVSAFACAVDGDCLKALSTCPKIDALCFWNCALKSQNFKYFPEFKNLTHLCINSTNCGDESMRQIGRCEKLAWLLVASNSFGNDGLKPLANLKLLTHLDISHNNVNMTGVRNLKGAKIKSLVLPPTVGRKNIQELKQLFPGCNLTFTKDGNLSDEDKVLFAPVH